MADHRISRRAVVPGLAAGATAALAGAAILSPAPAEAARRRRYSSICGPCKLWPGHSISFNVFLPAVQGGTDKPIDFRLVLKNVDGTMIATHDFQLTPGTGKEITLAAAENGSLTINGEQTDVTINLVVIAIIAILIGLLLPAVQKVQSTTTSFVPGRLAGEQTVDYILPFVEQDRLVP